MLTALLHAMSTEVIIGLLLLVLLLWWLSGPKTSRRSGKVLPGPRGLPLVGNLFIFLDPSSLHRKLFEYSKTYGKIFGLKIARNRWVLLNSADVIREAFIEKGQYFNERPTELSYSKKMNRSAGIIWSENWHHMRRFSLVSMRDFGLGKRSLEERIQEESAALTAAMEEKSGAAFKLNRLFAMATSNIICSIIVGHRFSYSDPEFDQLLRLLEKLVNFNPSASPENYFILAALRAAVKNKVSGGQSPVMETFLKVKKTAQRWMAEHKETLDPENTRDLIDLFLIESQKQNTNFDEESLVQCVFDLFAAGTETTSTTLQWAILYLSTHQQIQDKCREEILQELGTSRPPAWEDHKTLTYIMATLNEVQRIGSIVPLGVWHRAVADVTLSGFEVPKDSIVIANTYAVHRDEKVWGDPDTFRPERWIGQDGHTLLNLPDYMPFSTGKRACLGEQLAKKELFIFLVSMLQRFRFELADKDSKPNFIGKMGVTLPPDPYEVRVTKV